MPSPFPGMDPWLESPALFPDFHSRFLGAIGAAMNRDLPAPFFAALSTRVYMERTHRYVEPDVDILRPRNSWDSGDSGGGVATLPAVDEFVAVKNKVWPDEEFTELAVDIFTNDGENQLVTSIELLSPSNKSPGDSGRGSYLAKQYEMKSAGVNLVEIDLLRTGVHITNLDREELERLVGPFEYHISCFRTATPRATFGRPIRLAERLPAIPIPLVPGVPDVTVDLQAAFDRAYDEAAFSRRIRYDRPCDPPLTAEQRKWAEGILKNDEKAMS